MPSCVACNEPAQEGITGLCRACLSDPKRRREKEREKLGTAAAAAAAKHPLRAPRHSDRGPKRPQYSQQQLIVMRLEQAGGWIAGYDLHKIVVVSPEGDDYWLSHNAGRRARELAKAGKIERREVDKKGKRVPDGTGVVQYRAELKRAE